MPRSPLHRTAPPSVHLYDDDREWEVITTQRFRIGPNGERRVEEKRTYRAWIDISEFEDQEEAERAWEYWDNEQRKRGEEQHGARADSDDPPAGSDSRGPNAPGLSNLRLRAPVTLPSFSGSDSDSDSLSSSSHFVGSSPNTSYSKSSTGGSSSLLCSTASSAHSSSSGLSSSSGGPSGSSSTGRLYDSSSNAGIAPGRPARRG
ncbi:unnamed protein product [Tilletia laevis]|uniref:Uncharacterized protein n=3 Tax=Tilletia TaxID=13289 RepID=A0A8X7SS29_9BASI|nr:hypothetical protein CF336_g5444 [Tilletia laevis]KAE8236097.1 hypothetical protein A4X06_0g9659 [Tilletia controversa]CAD6885138.1 unnamed protein product [Tilletia caries]CAD6908590.1 unnamed protein product [Tilletia laevis]CAD6932635.1 unnamed protein product [Tilletia controversa]